MERYVHNARRWPRVPARCTVVVASRVGQWPAETEDLGPGGCQLVSPRVIAAGGEVRLAIAADALAERLSVRGRVAWTSATTTPVRLGVAFAAGQDGADPGAWFGRLLEANPAMAAASRRLPDRLPVSTWLYLGEPPRFVIDFTPQEIAVLRLLGDGARIADVQARQAMDVEESSRAIFSLLARRALTWSRAEAVAARRWERVLAQAEEALALELAKPAGSPPSIKSGPGAPQRPPAYVPAAPPGRKPAPAASQGAPPAAHSGPRGPEAQAILDEAQSTLAAGDISGAIALLRRALALSPRDSEISALLGQLAFRDRQI